MDLPPNPDLPFFAYGIFRPGQLAYFQLQDLVRDVTQPTTVPGRLLVRDGLPIADPDDPGYIKGVLLTFRPGEEAEAYGRISAMEPGAHYRWDEVSVNGVAANILVGRSPRKGSVPCEEKEWDGWRDPHFTAALDVVQETLTNSQDFDWNMKPLFRLQMAYLLLWASIERYVSLRYHLGQNATAKVNKLANERGFVASLKQQVKGRRELFRADRPTEKVVLDPDLPEKSIAYYYQVRSNIVHRGKAVWRDHQILRGALEELLSIFGDVLQAAQADAVRNREGIAE